MVIMDLWSDALEGSGSSSCNSLYLAPPVLGFVPRQNVATREDTLLIIGLTRINSAGALLAFADFSMYFRNIYADRRLVSVQYSSVQYRNIPVSPSCPEGGKEKTNHGFWSKVSVNIRKCITSYTESWRIISCLVIPVSCLEFNCVFLIHCFRRVQYGTVGTVQ